MYQRPMPKPDYPSMSAIDDPRQAWRRGDRIDWDGLSGAAKLRSQAYLHENHAGLILCALGAAGSVWGFYLAGALRGHPIPLQFMIIVFEALAGALVARLYDAWALALCQSRLAWAGCQLADGSASCAVRLVEAMEAANSRELPCFRGIAGPQSARPQSLERMALDEAIMDGGRCMSKAPMPSWLLRAALMPCLACAWAARIPGIDSATPADPEAAMRAWRAGMPWAAAQFERRSLGLTLSEGSLGAGSRML